ncbi:hypothetical protein KM043_016369 [Ampulex compressa]|nr:hypothetical protein KM043_016369 [Ampulex compressa]
MFRGNPQGNHDGNSQILDAEPIGQTVRIPIGFESRETVELRPHVFRSSVRGASSGLVCIQRLQQRIRTRFLFGSGGECEDLAIGSRRCIAADKSSCRLY